MASKVKIDDTTVDETPATHLVAKRRTIRRKRGRKEEEKRCLKLSDPDEKAKCWGGGLWGTERPDGWGSPLRTRVAGNIKKKRTHTKPQSLQGNKSSKLSHTKRKEEKWSEGEIRT